MDINAKTTKLRPMSQILKKRSVSLHKHRTSVALEPIFWDVIDAETARKGQAMAQFLMNMDERRIAEGYNGGLASYLRVWVACELKARAEKS